MKKCKTKDMDLITLKIMKVIIVVFFASCIVIEFFPDIFSECGIFLQHKDFFENILLGVLGSAVITYLVSYILFKQRKKEKENSIKQHLNKVGRKYWDLFLINDVSINEYINRSDELQKAVGELIVYCDEAYIYNKGYKKLIRICRDILIPLCIEVKVFSEILEGEKRVNQIYQNSVQNKENQDLKEIYDLFKEYLIDKFELKKMNQRFYEFSMIFGEIMDKIEKDKKEFWDLDARIKLEKQYRNMIDEYKKDYK